MTDLEMTKLCAEAMQLTGLQLYTAKGETKLGVPSKDYDNYIYDPLHDDAQAMALVKKFGLTIDPHQDVPPFTWRAVVAPNGDWEHQIHSEGSDLNYAIVECVAKMQAARTK